MADDEMPVARSPTTPNTLHSVTALARFEFEPGRGNDGTKIMMVEWQDENKERHKVGSWVVSWPGKRTSFAADDNPSDSTNRLYFLLPPGETIPPSITISYQPPNNQQKQVKGKTATQQRLQIQESSSRPSSRDGGPEVLRMSVNPLPAIFTPELGATAKASGKRGVLHTIWAKRRLQVLAREIQSESEFNLEGIGLEMALAEKQWIEQNFGLNLPQTRSVNPAGLKIDLGAVQDRASKAPLSPGIQSPRTPGGRRLTDKLKGLSLVTADGIVNTPTNMNPLSPEVGDMAVSSFATFKGDRSSTTKSAESRRMVAIKPPDQVTDDQAQAASASLAQIATHSSSRKPETRAAHDDEQVAESEDLFAKSLSPRDPDEPKSPFSIPSGEGGGGAFSRIKGTAR